MTITPSTTPHIITLFGLPLCAVTFAEAVEMLSHTAGVVHGRARVVVTPNVDHMVRLERMPEFATRYSQADFIFADGMPLVWFSRFIGRPLPQRVTGSDLFVALCNKAIEQSWHVVIIGGRPGNEAELQERFRQRFGGMRVSVIAPSMGFDPAGSEADAIAARVTEIDPDLVFVCVGFPRQELWAFNHAGRLRRGLVLCVGAAFEFALGMQKRAPRWMQEVGLEWLWRLLSEPRRLWRRYLVESWSFVRLCWHEWKQRPHGQ